MDDRLATLAAISTDQDAVIIEVVYRNRVVQFDIHAMELKHLPMTEIIDRYFRQAFADVQVTTAEETPQVASSSVFPLEGVKSHV